MWPGQSTGSFKQVAKPRTRGYRFPQTLICQILLHGEEPRFTHFDHNALRHYFHSVLYSNCHCFTKHAREKIGTYMMRAFYSNILYDGIPSNTLMTLLVKTEALPGPLENEFLICPVDMKLSTLEGESS